MKKYLILYMIAVLLLLSSCKNDNYIIHFDSNGGTQISDVMTSDLNLDQLSVPLKDGYTFMGWYIDESMTTIFDITTQITSDITIYAKWEINQYELSIYTYTYNQIDQVSLDQQESIFKIKSGTQDLYLMTSEHRVLRYSSNSHVESGDITNHFNLDTDEIIQFIDSGNNFSIALTSLHHVYTWGSNQSGNLGMDSLEVETEIPQNITDKFDLAQNEYIINIFADHDTTIVTTNLFRIFIYGKDMVMENGLLKQVIRTHPLDITDRFDLLSDEYITSFEIGDINIAALTSTHRLIIMGYSSFFDEVSNTFGDSELAIDVTDQFQLNASEYISSVQIAIYSIYALTSEGRLFVWHMPLNEQSTLNIYTEPTLINDLINLEENEVIEQFEMNQSNLIAYTSKNRIFTMGSNQFGLLGNDVDEQTISSEFIDISARFNVDPNDQVVSIGLGYSFSYVYYESGRIFMFGDIYMEQYHLESNSPTEISSASESVETILYDYDTILELTQDVNASLFYLDESYSEKCIFEKMPNTDLSIYRYLISR